MTLLTAPLDPDRDEARQLLENELRHPDYHRAEPIIPRIINWILERLESLIQFLPGSSGFAQIALAVVVVLVIGAIGYALLGRRRQSRLRAARPDGSVFDDPSITAAQYRARAEAAMHDGNWSAALLDHYRAIAASADERVLLDEAPGRTAHEIAVALGPTFPRHSAAIRSAADLFDEVRYGDHHASRAEADGVGDLDEALESARPEHRDTAVPAGPADVFGVPR